MKRPVFQIELIAVTEGEDGNTSLQFLYDRLIQQAISNLGFGKVDVVDNQKDLISNR